MLGKRPRLAAGLERRRGSVRPRWVADGATSAAARSLYAGARIGAGGDHRRPGQVRERSVVGARSVVGRGSSVDFDVMVGSTRADPDRVYVTGGSVVEDDVFLGPGVPTTNDNAMGRHAAGRAAAGAELRRACRVGGGRSSSRGRDRRGGVRRRRRPGDQRRRPARGRDGRPGAGGPPGRRRGPARALAVAQAPAGAWSRPLRCACPPAVQITCRGPGRRRSARSAPRRSRR